MSLPKKKDKRAASPLEAQRRATQQQTLQVNLSVLMRIDPSVVEILDMAGHVVVYKFDMGTQGWQKQDIEGSLFVIRRNTYPSYRSIMQIEGTYLILRPVNSPDVIGMWFYKEEEHACITSLVQNIIAQLQSYPPPPNQHPAQRPGRPPFPQTQQPPPTSISATNSAGAQLMAAIMQSVPPTSSPPLQHQSPHHHHMHAPMPSPSLGASDALKGMLGIKPVMQPPVMSLGGAEAGAKLLGMLGVAAPGVAAASTPAPAETNFPQPPAEPPSPGTAIMAMLGRASVSSSSSSQPPFPSSAPVPQHAPVQQHSTLPPALLAAAARQTSASSSSSFAPEPPSVLLAPHQLINPPPARQQNDGLPRKLLIESVEGSAAKAQQAGHVMDKKMFEQALTAAVKDETFIAELYTKYLALSKPA